MAINRYSNLSTSKFDPLSLQEVMMVPLYKQQQYDKLEADRIATQDALKINPLDVHTERAKQLQSDFDNKVTELAKYQARTGDIQGAKSKLLDLHREYKRLTDPMGEVSQINQYNKEYQDERTRFLESASKQYGSDRAIQLWNEHAKKYTGYNEAGKLTGITPRGIVAAKDFDKELQQYHNLLGSTATAAANSGYRIKDSGQGDGSKVMVNRSGQVVRDSNIEQLNSMRKAMAADWLSPTGEGFRYNTEAGVDPTAFQNKFNNLMDAQLRNKLETKTDESGNYISAPSGGNNKKGKEPSIPAGIAEAVQLNEQTDKDLKVIDSFKGIGARPVGGSPLMLGTSGGQKLTPNIKGMTGAERQKLFQKQMSQEQQQRYIDTYNALKAQNKLPKNANLFDDKTINKIREDWKTNTNINYTNNLIVPGSEESNRLYSPTMDKKEKGERDLFANTRLNIAKKNNQQLLFDENGEPIDVQKVKNISVLAHYSPLNILPAFGGNPKNTVSPHVVSYTDENDEKHTAYMPRDENEMKNNPNFTGASVINQTGNKVLRNPNKFMSFDKRSMPEIQNFDLSPLGINKRGIDAMRVKYDSTNKTYTIEIIDNGKTAKTAPLSSENYQNLLYDMNN